MIPEDKQPAVTRALLETFGVSEIEDIQQMTKGNTGALVYRIVVKGSPHLLRIVMRANDPTLPDHFACMKLAAEARLSPRVLHTSLEDRLSITHFIETAPFSLPDALARMPATLRALHALPPFPKRADHLNTTCTFLLNKGPATEAYLQRIQAANIFPKAESDEVFARYEQLVTAYSRQESDMVSSHNDLFKPDNILFDGARVWLVDWEAAFQNDRYADLAVVSNMLVADEDQERVFLEAYLGAPPDHHQLARFFLMSQLAHMFYAMAFLFIGSLGAPIDWTQPVPEFNDLRRRVWSGEFNMTAALDKITYGRAHLAQLLQNVNRQKFNESLTQLS